MAVPSPDLAALRQLGERVRPLSAAGERTLPVPPAFAALLPWGGLQRGSLVATGGSVATSLALALAGPTTAAGAWLAVVGLPHLGLLAAAELGVALERTLLVADPGPRAWAGAVAALLDAVDVVMVRPSAAVSTSAQRRLLARARERGSVLIQAGGPTSVWAEAPELTVAATASHWEGLEDGHGRLRARRVLVAVSGRRGAARARHADLWLPGPDGRVGLAAPVAPVAAPVGSPAHEPLREVG
ncbi:MAG: hypothetical protein JWM47_271 [Acidimicrobiales bacterium]|nr:hypothetical protein [Acidimicrobiales bacterium]